MNDPFWSWILLCASAVAAGAVNSVAGGGTLLTFPSLLAVLSPVGANATSTFALFPGSLASGFGYRKELALCRPHLVRLLPPSLIGGLIGSLLVTRLPERIFASAVPWLLIGASILLLVQRPIARYLGTHPHDKPTPKTVAVIVFFQLLVGIYGGYFGAGIGILMLSSLAFMGIPDIHQMNAVKSILAAAMNAITLVIFALSGAIVWKYALVMGLAGTIGGYAGARVARRMKPDYIRAFVVFVGFAVAFYSWFGKK
ncbi:sulfite exporter TauE/SafE family protein [Horticoccus sp. 23ND18S-11]|uniref:sulfite exporter TauE/SafE family protein n=1 Tax=Horticoccus sp. 23ND18S-11 TaxID=3391832 RepID=UPI0039C94443